MDDAVGRCAAAERSSNKRTVTSRNVQSGHLGKSQFFRFTLRPSERARATKRAAAAHRFDFHRQLAQGQRALHRPPPPTARHRHTHTHARARARPHPPGTPRHSALQPPPPRPRSPPPRIQQHRATHSPVARYAHPQSHQSGHTGHSALLGRTIERHARAADAARPCSRRRSPVQQTPLTRAADAAHPCSRRRSPCLVVL